jgi:hypothetical protein
LDAAQGIGGLDTRLASRGVGVDHLGFIHLELAGVRDDRGLARCRRFAKEVLFLDTGGLLAVHRFGGAFRGVILAGL